MSSQHVFSSFLLTLIYWVLDSACSYPFTFNPLTTIFNLASPSFVLNFLFLQNWTYRALTSIIQLTRHQPNKKCVDTLQSLESF